MTKITNELLEDYALCYPRIECLKIKHWMVLRQPLKFIGEHWLLNEVEYIQLRSIDSITDEEARRINRISDLTINAVWHLKAMISGDLHVKGSIFLSIIQYLKSIGIATPTIDGEGNIITVDELVESGKLKLI